MYVFFSDRAHYAAEGGKKLQKGERIDAGIPGKSQASNKKVKEGRKQ